MAARDEVRKAVERRSPEYVPLLWADKPDWSDVIETGVAPARGWEPSRPGETEWGYVFEMIDDTFGQVRNPPGSDWETALAIQAPDPDAPGRFDHIGELRKRYPDRYINANIGISGFGTMTGIRGFEDLLEGLYTAPQEVRQLAEKVVAYECGLVRQLARHGADAVGFWDDWGSQLGLFIRPEQWREFFKPLYRRQFALCHELGLHVFFHSCGQVTAIVPDLIEIGADMLNLSQMTLYMEEVAEIGAGKACFVCPVDLQRGLYLDAQGIEAQIARMIDLFGGGGKGGIIGQTQRYTHLGCEYEVTSLIADIFCRLGGRPPLHRMMAQVGSGVGSSG